RGGFTTAARARSSDEQSVDSATPRLPRENGGLQSSSAPVNRARRNANPIVFPERPKLAPGVTLAGQMKESAFKNPPWLIEREDAGYVQVPEVLYRIAE